VASEKEKNNEGQEGKVCDAKLPHAKEPWIRPTLTDLGKMKNLAGLIPTS